MDDPVAMKNLASVFWRINLTLFVAVMKIIHILIAYEIVLSDNKDMDKKEKINLPVTIFDKKEEQACSICLVNFVHKISVAKLDCGHLFH